MLAVRKAASFPENAPEVERKEVIRSVMKILRQVLFMTFVLIGFSMTAMAQKDDNQNRPKKDPPQIVVPDKDKPKDRPKDDNNNNNNRPKKPNEEFSLSGGNQTEISSI